MCKPLLSDIVPTPARGVVRLETCDTCRRVVPIMGAPGKGRPLETFPGGDFFCAGHAMRVGENPFA